MGANDYFVFPLDIRDKCWVSHMESKTRVVADRKDWWANEENLNYQI